MDLTQRKLTRSEWDSIELPVAPNEKMILSLICDGFSNINIKKNSTASMFSFIKIDFTREMEGFLYDKYFKPVIQDILKKYPVITWTPVDGGASSMKSGQLKKIDMLRIQNVDANIQTSKEIVYEFILLEHAKNLAKYLTKNKAKYAFYLYTLIHMRKASISNVNAIVQSFVNSLIEYANAKTDLTHIVKEAVHFIEQNKYITTYEDNALYVHQKQLFSIFNQKANTHPKLVLYSAPTGTGKTLSPLGLSMNYRIIFVCVARHIGLALAKSAISMEKKIAFAFGCETASDIRLHYFAAADYTRDYRSGGIRKVDNSNGIKVEIMICDVQSYLTAMNYMLAFNGAETIITYWDEPTITLDYETHFLHDTIHKNWVENKIPNMVLSCATLPKESEIVDTLGDFRMRFDGAEIHSVTSYDCKKSIPIITKDGYCAVPHTMYSEHGELVECVRHCIENKTLLRYFDLGEIVKFAFYVNSNGLVESHLKMENYFGQIEDIHMNSLKIYYLELLQHMSQEHYSTVYTYMKSKQEKPFSKQLVKSVSVDSVPFKKMDSYELKRTQSEAPVPQSAGSSGILLTTKDAYTLTDGPTIFLSEDALKIGKFYTQQSAIPLTVYQDIMKKIVTNNKVSQEMEEIERALALLDKSDESKKTKAKEKDDENKSQDIRELYKKLDVLRKKIKYISLDAEYVPNTKPHQEKWTSTVNSQAFCPNIDEDTVKTIMGLHIEDTLKVLLLLGIGLFIADAHPEYLEVMKRLAQSQDLFIIIASSDFVFGTNYNFCHGFIGKDMANMTQAKTIQCLGRIGRSNINSTYTVRFRSDEFIYNLFKTPDENVETNNMCRLFSS